MVLAVDLKNTGSNLVDFSSVFGGNNSQDSLWAITGKALNSGIDLNGVACLSVFPDTVTGFSTQAVLLPLSNAKDFAQFLQNEFGGILNKKNELQWCQTKNYTLCFSDEIAILGFALISKPTPGYMLEKLSQKRKNKEAAFSSLFSQKFEVATWADLTRLPGVSDLAQLSGKMQLTTYSTFKNGSIETDGMLVTNESTGPLLNALFKNKMQKDEVGYSLNDVEPLAQIHFKVNIDNLWNELDKMGKLTEFRINSALMGFDAELMKNMVNGSYSLSLLESGPGGFTPFGSLRLRIGLKNPDSFDKMMNGFVRNQSMEKTAEGKYQSKWFPNTSIEKKNQEAFITMGKVLQKSENSSIESSSGFPANWTFEPINFKADLGRMSEKMKIGTNLSDVFVSARPENNGTLHMKFVVNTNKPNENALKTLLETSRKSLLKSNNSAPNI